jgi:hypothetical protein
MKKAFKAVRLALMGVVWLFLMATSCHKAPPEPEPDLPPETQTGEGTIGCYINGKPWWPKPFLAIGTDPYLKALISPVNQSFFLKAIYKEKKIPDNEQFLQISCETPKIGINIIRIYPVSVGSMYFVDYSKSQGCGNYIIDSTKTRNILLTKIDTTGVGILSGTFEFTAFNACGDTLRFTKGRFDY